MVVVVRDVWQWGPVLAQCVVTGIGVVVVVTVRNVCQAKHIVWQLYYLNDNNKNASLRSTCYKNNSEVQLDHIVAVDNRPSIDNNS